MWCLSTICDYLKNITSISQNDLLQYGFLTMIKFIELAPEIFFFIKKNNEILLSKNLKIKNKISFLLFLIFKLF